jgi:hypothetical protein
MLQMVQSARVRQSLPCPFQSFEQLRWKSFLIEVLTRRQWLVSGVTEPKDSDTARPRWPRRRTDLTSLRIMFLLCSKGAVEREHLSSILLSAPAWARLGLTVADPRLRERAADALAATIVERLENPAPAVDRHQLMLPL